jgi:hypothetical protein
VERGDWLTLLMGLPFGERTAQRLMEIARHPVLSDPTHGSRLPPSWRTLYELTRLPNPLLLAKIKDHTINSEMERRDVAAIAASVAKPEVIRVEVTEVEATEAEWPKSLPEPEEVIEAEVVEITPNDDALFAIDDATTILYRTVQDLHEAVVVVAKAKDEWEKATEKKQAVQSTAEVERAIEGLITAASNALTAVREI